MLLILAGVTISAISNEGLLGKASKANFKTKMASYKEQAELYASWQIMETMNTNTKSINAGEILKELIEAEVVNNIKVEDVTHNIEEILEGIKKEEKEYLVIFEGELCYVSSNNVKNNKQQVKWCEEMGIRILDYTPPTGMAVRNGKYELVNGVYLCTPNVTQGFKAETTRYLQPDSNGNLVPGNWIKDKPEDNWYDYKNQKWSNIYV